MFSPSKNFFRFFSTAKASGGIEALIEHLCNQKEVNLFESMNEAKTFCYAYSGSKFDQKTEYLKFISEKCAWPDPDVFQRTAFSLGPPDCPQKLVQWAEQLRSDAQPRYTNMMKLIAHLDNGVKFLSDLRADLRKLERSSEGWLRLMDHTLRDLLSVWFSVGMLELKRVTWQSSAQLLEKVSVAEAVHPMNHWGEIKHRVGPYRRCYVFTHPAMPDEPLVVLYVALLSSIADSIDSIVRLPPDSFSNLEQLDHAKAAIFYSITSIQEGLKGIDLGNMLIKKVVSEIKNEMPQIYQFSTLSPIPGFRKWLLHALTSNMRNELLSENGTTYLINLFNLPKNSAKEVVLAKLKQTLESSDFLEEQNLATDLRPVLLHLAGRYLFEEKRRGKALDPVANFHLRNGSEIWRLNWNADQSQRGFEQSFGIMVNYRYFLEDLFKNSRHYFENDVIKCSDDVIQSLRLFQK